MFAEVSGSQYADRASINLRRFSRRVTRRLCLFGLVANDVGERGLGDCARGFHQPKERSDKALLARLNRAADVIVYECSGLMFWFMRKKFVGSYLAFKATRRS
jgi:hypothetical protein